MYSHKEKGSVTIEAAIVIIMFIFGWIALTNLVNILRAQVIIQYAITQASKEMSAYCYIVSKTGLLEDSRQMGADAATAKASADETIDAVVKLYQGIQNGSENVSNAIVNTPIDGNYEEYVNTIEGVSGQTYEELVALSDGVSTQIDKMASASPEAIMKGLLYVGKDEAMKAFKSYVVAAPLSKAMVKDYLDVYGYDQNGADILKRLGIVDGIEGLDFHGSTLFNDGETIDIAVTYRFRAEIPYFDKIEMDLSQCASTRAWGALEGNDS